MYSVSHKICTWDCYYLISPILSYLLPQVAVVLWKRQGVSCMAKITKLYGSMTTRVLLHVSVRVMTSTSYMGLILRLTASWLVSNHLSTSINIKLINVNKRGLWGIPNLQHRLPSCGHVAQSQTPMKVGPTLAQRRDDSTDVGPTLGQPILLFRMLVTTLMYPW